MVSSFYSSNESKQRKYIKENKIRELNQEAQQEIVDAQIDAELGLESKATQLSTLSKRITDKLVGVKPEVLKGDAILVRAINNSELSELFNRLKALPDSLLTKTQRIIRDDLSNSNNKKAINSLIQEALPDGIDAIKLAVIKALGGSGNEESVLEMITKTKDPKAEINFNQRRILKKTKGTQTQSASQSLKLKKKTQAELDEEDNLYIENALMGAEDINYALKPIPAKRATTAQIRAQARAQAELDLIPLQQQDAKEARKARTDYENEFEIPMEKMLMSKEDTLSRLSALNSNQDYAFREKFDNVLDGIASQAKTVADKRLWRQMKAAIERQRMEDAYKEWVENATKSAFAEKIQKNLKALIWNQKLKQKNERNMMGAEDINYSVPIPKRRSNSNATTEQGTLAGEKLDMRQLNTGRPSKPIEEKYSEMMQILSKPVSKRSRDEKKKLANFRGSNNKDRDVMLTMKDMLDRIN